MADNNDSLIREVEEELRREKFEALFKQYGGYIIAAGVAVLVSVGGYQYWQYSARVAAESAGARYEDATQLAVAKKGDEAAKALEALAGDGPAGYATLARLQLAGLHMENGKKAEALAVFDEIANSTSVDPLLKDYAKLQAAALRIGESDWTEIKNRLNDLSGPASPWRFNAKELVALAASAAGKNDEALKVYEEIAGDRDAPATLSARAKQMVTRLSLQSAVSNDTGADDAVKPAGAAGSGKATDGAAAKADGEAASVSAEEKSPGGSETEPDAGTKE